jgi:hypothetical protein
MKGETDGRDSFHASAPGLPALDQWKSAFPGTGRGCAHPLAPKLNAETRSQELPRHTLTRRSNRLPGHRTSACASRGVGGCLQEGDDFQTVLFFII